MTDELGREELRTIVDDVFRSWENIDEKYHKAKWQIIEMIQKPGVTEEWIEEKAKEGIQVFYRVFYYGEGLGKEKNKSTLAENFIRSLVEEIRNGKR